LGRLKKEQARWKNEKEEGRMNGKLEVGGRMCAGELSAWVRADGCFAGADLMIVVKEVEFSRKDARAPRFLFGSLAPWRENISQKIA